MKKFFKISSYVIVGLIVLVLLVYMGFSIKWKLKSNSNFKLLGDIAATLTEGGHEYRDLNKNGQLDIYEDSRADLESRVNDLLGQMNLEEKAGMMFITMIGMNPDGTLSEAPRIGDKFSFFLETNSSMVIKKKMNHFNILFAPSPESMIEWHNNMQKMAERTRLGIPVTIASDPRHTTSNNPGAGIPTPGFSKWPSPLGFAATRDTALMREFGDIARQEYKTIGIRLALSPMADLATDPRWGRSNGTFGEDATISAQLTKAYILGFQGDSLTNTSVACMAKHFPGGGPQKDGEDAHFPYGAEQVYPGDNFDYHLIPFEKGVFPAKTAQIMPYYGKPMGSEYEEVGFGFNKQIITGLLRKKYGFEGVVCTDWNLISDSPVKPGAAWGVEHLSLVERTGKILDAGCDMIGGEAEPQWIIDLVENNVVTEDRLDVSIRRILLDKFRLGLFDNPYLSKENVAIVGNDSFIEKGRIAQKRSIVLLKNENNFLPLKEGVKVYLVGIHDDEAKSFATIVKNPEDADVIIQKLATPFTPRDDYMLEQFFHQGRLNFTKNEKETILKRIHYKPTVTIMNMERPAIFPDINNSSTAVIADFDCQDDILLEMIFGAFAPTGKLPFEIPSSIESVNSQMEDVPYDSKDPLYKFGHGLGYE